MKTRQSLFLGILLLASAGAAKAAPFVLSDLIDSNGSITIGDAVFGDFHFSSVAFDPRTATVDATMLDGVYYLSLQGPFVSTSSNFTDIAFGYSLHTLSGLPLINQIGQSYVLSALGSGGFVAIGETAFDRTPGTNSSMQAAQSTVGFFLGINDARDPSSEPGTGDQLFLTPRASQLWVETDIALLPNSNGLVGATTITQSFHFDPIPEPSTWCFLLGSLGLALGVYRRRRVHVLG